VEFYNKDFEGGLVVFINGKKVESFNGSSYTCYIRGAKCLAQEGRFGGIVVMPNWVTVANCKNVNNVT
jgi:hypothetical protein